MTIPPEALHYLRATAMLLATWSLLSQLRWVVAVPELRPGGVLHDVAPLRALRQPFAHIASPLGVAVVTAIRVIGAALLLVGDPALLALGFALTLTGSLAMTFAFDLGDGSDKFGQIVAMAGLLAAVGLWRGDAALGFAGVLLAGGQLTICYGVAGVAKVLREDWRNGRVVVAVMVSETQGHPFAARVLRDRRRALALSWAVMLAEALFPLALLAPAPVLWAALGVFLVFHWATAWAMGLNTYPWAFTAAFPAALLLGGAVRSQL